MKELIKLNHCGYKNWQQWWFDEVFVLKYVHLCFFMILLHFYRFSLIFKKYKNKMIYKSDNKKKAMCLRFNLTPILVLWGK